VRPDGPVDFEPLQVFTATGGRVARHVLFADPAVFEAFDLPERVSSGELRQAR